MKTMNVLCAIVPLSVFLFSCGNDAPPETKKSPPAVEGYIVKPKKLSENVSVAGTIQSREETVLMPEISGRITMLNIPEGAVVQKGTLLVKMFDADLQAQSAKLKAQLATAKVTADRLKQLHDVEGVSQQEFDIATTAVTTLEAELALNAAQISKTEIRAPFTGTLGLRRVSEGAFVSVGTPIVSIREENNLTIDFSVPETYSAAMKKSMKVYFTVSSDTTEYTATVIATDQQVNSGSLNLQVRAQVDEKQNPILPGSSANVVLRLGTTDSALVIPTGAIIPDVRFKKVMVMRAGKVAYAQVTTGVRGSSEVEIISGLSIGDTIVTSGIQFLRPGSGAKFSSIK
jgi:membrane fusion protein (multidrug efflux system)